MMAQLPTAFMETTRRLMGDERFERYVRSFDEPVPVSIRLNPLKTRGAEGQQPLAVADVAAERVGWCPDGWYLTERPNFTMDPLLHAGCYYVQEASSMFLAEVLRCTVNDATGSAHYDLQGRELAALDLCAAPGGKSTLLRAVLPEHWTVWSNEPVRQRASVLAENVAKWGYAGHHVTNNYPRDYRKSGMKFDVIVCDVPCSGEGMFRKDAATIGEWSLGQVDRCAALQRDIVGDAWACLNPGGLMVYSTCTFNTRENEENIQWLLNEFADAEMVTVETRPEWNITGSLLEGFDEPVYRFIPGITRGEGLFMCAIRKAGNRQTARSKGKPAGLHDISVSLHPSELNPACPVELSYRQAMDYLRREAITLPADAPRGVVDVAFMGRTLGPVKNIGTRANNLYPKEWRIKTTHLAQDYVPVLKPVTQ